MTIYVGGLRARLIHDSLYNMVKTGLTDLGWFTAGREHLPLSTRSTAVQNDEEISLNTLVVSSEDTISKDDEMGSDMAEHRTTFYVDFYAENEVVGKHLIGDVRDILAGRMPSVGRSAPILPVYDYTQATPPVITTCELEDILVDRAHDFPKAFQKYWFACRVVVVDHYGNENDG